jgi:hypothetical protein
LLVGKSNGNEFQVPVLKAIKFFIALLLVPAAVGLGRGLWHVIAESSARHWWGTEFFFPWLMVGAILGIGALFFFPVPVRTYVAGHELTHAMWAKMCGGKVKAIKIKADSGYIISDCNNFLVTLAPYIFPFYAWLAWCVFASAQIVYHQPWIQKAGWITIGMALAFHFYFLGRVIFTRQSDFKSQGYFFSYVVILIGNGLLVLAICLLQKSSGGEWKGVLADIGRAYLHSFFWVKSLFS